MAQGDKIIAGRSSGQTTPPDLNTDIFALLESLRLEHANAENQSAEAISALTNTTFDRRETQGISITPATVEAIKQYLGILANSIYIDDAYDGSNITTPISKQTQIKFSDYQTWKTRVTDVANCPITNTGFRSSFNNGYNNGFRSGYNNIYNSVYDSGFNGSYNGGYRTCDYCSDYRICWGAYTENSGLCGANGYRASNSTIRG